MYGTEPRYITIFDITVFPIWQWESSQLNAKSFQCNDIISTQSQFKKNNKFKAVKNITVMELFLTFLLRWYAKMILRSKHLYQLYPLYPPCHSIFLLYNSFQFLWLLLPWYNNVFGYFTAILLYLGLRYNDSSI